MGKRRVPSALYDTVYALASQIAKPADVGQSLEASALEAVAAKKARAELMALFHKHQQAGTHDPFLTETVADFTDDPAEAARLYRLALEQCTGHPGEPLHSKRLGLIEALLKLGEIGAAREELARARKAAFAAADRDAIDELDALARQLKATS